MKHLTFIFFGLFFLLSCSGEEEIKKWPDVGDYYDPGKPIMFESMVPSWGRIDQAFVIKGNFPKDLGQIKVYFNDKRAVLVNCDGREIMGMVPKQAPGNNKVSLVVGSDSIVPQGIVFRYYQTQSVKNVIGRFDTEGEWMEGNLDEAKIQRVTSIGVVNGQKGDNIIISEGDWEDKVSFVSFDDHVLMRLTGIGYMGAVAVDNTRDKACIMARNNRTLYTSAREDGWTITTTGLEIPELTGDLHGGMTYAEDNRYLYIMTEGNMFEVDIEDKSYKRLFSRGDHAAFNGVNLGSWWQYLVYSKYHKCFFASYADANGIFKITKTSQGTWEVEKYAGFNSGNTTFGDKLADAVLQAPCGMAVNSEGEIYVCCKNAHCIVKIRGNIVSLVAGNPGRSPGRINGYPLDAYFNNPTAIAIDSDENFFIGETGARVVRKMTIE